MPWKAVSENGKWQVRKLHDDGTPGEAVGEPHATHEEALDHVAALYSNTPDATASEEPTEMKANLMSGAIQFEADETNPRLLHFKDYVLARPETNKNRDRVDEAGILELAESIPLMPIDFNHDPKRNAGTFTAGRVGAEGELRVDGVIWLDRCQENGVSAQDVYDGKLLMSIEADASTAECSVCHKIHSNESQYCEHLKIQGNDQGIRSKIKYGAERIMRGLRALGGAFTYKPAGTGTGADLSSRILFAASHLEPENVEVSLETNKENASMDEKEEVKETPEEEKVQVEEKKDKDENADMKAEYETMKASLAEMTAKLEAANQEKANVETKLQTVEAQLVEVNNKVLAHEASLKAFKVNELKSKLVGSVMDEEEFVAKQETLLGLPEDAIELMTRNNQEQKPTDGRLNLAASEQQTPERKLVLF